MKILQITAAYKPAYVYGGPTMSVAKLSEQLGNAGLDVTVFTTTANGTTELTVPTGLESVVEGVPVIYFKRLTKDHSHFSPQLIYNTWRKAKKFDVVHIHGWWNLVSLISCLIVIVRGGKVIVSPRGMLSNYSFLNKNSFIKKLIFKFITLPLLRRCTIHATTLHEQKQVNSLINTTKIFVIPNFVELPQNVPQRSIKQSKTLQLIFLSRIEEKKGLDILFNALRNVNIPYRLTIAGGGEPAYIESLNRLAAEYRISDHLSWLGFQNENKFQLLTNHHLLVLPSHDENFGNVVIESLAVGTPVLISEQVGLADYVRVNNLGWTFENNPESLAGMINKIDNESLEVISKRAPGVISNDFNNQHLIQQYNDMYQAVSASS